VALIASCLTLAAACAPSASAPARKTFPPPHTVEPKVVFGMSMGDTLPGMTPTALNATLADLVTLGVTSIRADLAWPDVQPTSAASWDWSGFDRVVAAATAHHLTVLALLSYTPPWARAATCTVFKCPPADDNAFAAFATAAARRYGPQGVRQFEIWNEPNQGSSWSPSADAAGYATLLRTTANAIHGVDPTLRVVSGGLAPTATGNGDVAQLTYLQQLCAMGALTSVDAIGYHPYSYPVPATYDASWNAWRQISATSTSFETILSSCGQSGKRILATEYGAPTNGPGGLAVVGNYGFGSSPDHVDEALQSQILSGVVTAAEAEPDLSAVYLYSYRDAGTDPSTVEDWFGLRRNDGSAKPAWNAVQQALATYAATHP
jgi:hypothetical protein